jgi:hypothetical protein
MEHFALGKILLWSGRFEDAKKFHMGVAYGRARFDLVDTWRSNLEIGNEP